MLTLSLSMAALIGAVLALWLGVAVWAVWTGLGLRKKAEFSTSQADRLASLLDSAPALPLMVRNDGRIEAPSRLADWLGLPKVPNFVTDLVGNGVGLSEEDAQALSRDVTAAQKTGRSFSRALRAQGSARTLLVKGAPAAVRIGQTGSVILWWFDATESQAEIGRLGEEVTRLKLAFSRLSGLIEAAPIPMWYRGPDMALALVNDAYVRAVEGESAAGVIERGVELIDAGGGTNPLSSAKLAMEKGEAVSNIVPVTVAGERRSFRLVDVPLGEAGVAGYALDVEEVELANAAFRRFAATQRDMLDRLSASVAQFGPDRALTFSNEAFLRLFGIKPEWVAERPNFDRLLDRMREAGRVPEVRDFPAWKEERKAWFRASGETIEENWLLSGGQHLRLVAQPIPDGGLLLIFEDRTEQAQLASARDTLLRVRTATFDNLFEAIGVFEADGRLHNWNNRFRDSWDFEEAFLGSHPHVDGLVEAAASRLVEPERAGLIRDLVKAATVDRTQRSGRLSLKNGRYFEFASVPLPDGNALLTMLDITDSRKVEGALRERAEALEEADKVKTDFVANMSYELRTPLTSISGYAEMLDSGLAGPLEAQAQDYVKSIIEASGRLSGMIDRVLDLTQDDSGALPLERKPIELALLVHDAAREHRPIADAKGIEFIVRVDPMVGAMRGDTRRLREALDHLLDNAIFFTPAGGRVLLHADGDQDQALIVVSDNGPGMDAAEQTRAFDRFSRVSGARDGDPALGLGLPLARQFVEAHGGKLSLMSEVGEGTAISIELPRS
jgi:signal transduction histidine kinase/PAS domain-containing protein